jgi:hypothetical protein
MRRAPNRQNSNRARSFSLTTLFTIQRIVKLALIVHQHHSDCKPKKIRSGGWRSPRWRIISLFCTKPRTIVRGFVILCEK